MSNKLKQKLNSSQGAAVMIALFYLLLCSIFGAVVLSAATGNVRRAEAGAESLQPMYTLTSAAQLVADGLGQATYSRNSYGEIEYDNGQPGGAGYSCGTGYSHAYTRLDSAYDTNGNLSFTGGSSYLQSAISSKFKLLADAVYTNSTQEKTATLLVEADGLEDVVVQMDMDEEYNLTVTVSLDETLCSSIVLYYPASVKDVDSTPRATHEYGVIETVFVYEDDGNGGQTVKLDEHGDPVTEDVVTYYECEFSCTRTETTVSWASKPQIWEQAVN